MDSSLFANSQMQTIVILIAIDVVLGIIASLVKKEFVLGKVGNFVKGPVLGYVFGFTVLKLALGAFPSLSMVGTLAYVLVIAALIGSLLNNLAKFGLPVPKMLKK